MSKIFSYTDAVRLLGGKGPIVKAIEQIAGGVALAGAVTGAPALLNLIQARTDFVERSHKLVRGIVEKRSGLTRYARTQRLEAAHAVLVIVAYFEAFNEADLPVSLADLELTKEEQAALDPAGAPLEFFSDWGWPVVRAGQDGDAPGLRLFYSYLSGRLWEFIGGLAVIERLSERQRREIEAALSENIPDQACTRYQELLRQLALDVPEVGHWVNQYAHAATRSEVRELRRQVGTAMAGLERMLVEAAVGGAPDQRRSSLARAHRDELDRPIVSSGEVPEGVRLPTLDAGYLAPRFRATSVFGKASLSEESWWEQTPVRDGLEEFLAGHLLSSHATEAPLLVLGQPGSGKSVLTKVLAARLPAQDFLSVRVVLREAPATADMQTQIEHAVRTATGESLDWPALARSAGDALPVVILDGFDELLQATGVAQTDYLTRVADFQRREAVQGRPVAVIVTSRTSVADRARPPARTTALRLEPFDSDQVAEWLATWNQVNAGPFRERGIEPLPAKAVLAHSVLAEQPLLLLMLALYDADGNALQRAREDLRQDQLYERLLRTFARREVTKHRPSLPDQECDAAVERELRDLSGVAFAMFNRGSQWVTESDLDSDLPALFPDARLSDRPGGHELRAPLRVGERLLGRFFFVHRSQATRDDSTLETYEFLHATFGEYLVARLTWQVMRDLVQREQAGTFSISAAPVNDDLLHALLSFAVLSRRTPVIIFLREMSEALTEDDRVATTELLIRLFRTVHQHRGSRGFERYQPRRLGVPARHAVYAANLVLLTGCVASTVRVSQLFGTEGDPIPEWRNEAMLWRSQLDSEDWQSVVEAFVSEREWNDEHRRDLQLRIRREPVVIMVPIDPYWSEGIPPGHEMRNERLFRSHPSAVHRSAYFVCDVDEDMVYHGIEPVLKNVEPAVTTVVGYGRSSPASVLHAVLGAWLLPVEPGLASGDDLVKERQTDLYELCVKIIMQGFPPGLDDIRSRCASLLLHRLTTDGTVSPSLVANVLERLDASEFRNAFLDAAANDVIRCGLEFLGRDPDADQQIRVAIKHAAGHSATGVEAMLAERAREALLPVDRSGTHNRP